MVLRELVSKPGNYSQLNLAKTDTSFILKFQFPDIVQHQVTKQYKEIHVDNKTFIPFYRYQTAEVSGSKTTNVSHLSDIKISSPDPDPFLSKDFLKDYRFIPSKETENIHARLLNTKAPDAELTDINGQKRSLAGTEGKVILLDFWEIWCGPCLQSIDKLKDISSKYSQSNFEVWSIVSDETTFKKVKDFVDRRSIKYPVFYGTEKTSADYYVFGVPLYVIIDKKGIIRYAKAGFTSELEDEIKKYLN